MSEPSSSKKQSDESVNPAKPCIRLNGLGRDGGRSAFSPYKPSTILTNLQRGNVQKQTPSVLPERSVFQLAAQGELFLQNTDESIFVDIQDENGFTPLIWASAYGQLATVRILLENKASPSVRGSFGETALLFACANGHVAVLKELLKHDINVDDRDEDGNTALMYAAYGNHAHCANELLLAGCDLTAENSSFETAYAIAVNRRNKKVQAIIEKYMMKLLLEADDDNSD